MRYKFNKSGLLSRMRELDQNQHQRILYLRYNISVLFDEFSFKLFDIVAQTYNLYYMMLNEAFELIRLNYQDYLIIVQSTEHHYSIEIRKK